MRITKHIKFRRDTAGLSDKKHFDGEPFERYSTAKTLEEANKKAEGIVVDCAERFSGLLPYLVIAEDYYKSEGYTIYCHRWAGVDPATRELTQF